MTWMRIRPELFGQAAADGLSGDALMAHLEALAWLYAHERADCVIPPRVLRAVFSMTDNVTAATTELVKAEYWTQRPDGGVEVVEHAGTVRQSLVAQEKKRHKDRRAYESRRGGASSSSAGESASGTDSEPDSEPDGGYADPLTTDRTTQLPRGSENEENGPPRDCCRDCGRPSSFLVGGLCRRGDCIEQRKDTAA